MRGRLARRRRRTPGTSDARESRRRSFADKAGAPQSSIRLGLVGIERKNPDYYRALVMNQILGGTFKRLTLNLRETKGWTYGVASMFEARRAPGPWTAGGEFVSNTSSVELAPLALIARLAALVPPETPAQCKAGYDNVVVSREDHIGSPPQIR